MRPAHRAVKGEGARSGFLPLPPRKCVTFAQLMRALGISALALLLMLGACKTSKDAPSTTTTTQQKPQTMTTASGLQYVITTPGTGESPKPGQTVSVHYVGKLTDGKEFDNSYTRGQPIDFVLGKGMVISGWDEGIALLNKGAKATLTIPPALGYGARGAGGVIPPNATLVFDVELVSFK